MAVVEDVDIDIELDIELDMEACCGVEVEPGGRDGV